MTSRPRGGGVNNFATTVPKLLVHNKQLRDIRREVKKCVTSFRDRHEGITFNSSKKLDHFKEKNIPNTENGLAFLFHDF